MGPIFFLTFPDIMLKMLDMLDMLDICINIIDFIDLLIIFSLTMFQY